MKRIILIALAFSVMFLHTACGIISPFVAESKSSSSAPDRINQSKEPTTKERVQSTEPEKRSAYEISYSHVKAYQNYFGTTKFQIIYEVTNTGSTDLYLSSGSFDIETQEGTLVASKTSVSVFPEVISPGEKAYYYRNIELDNYSGDGSDLVLFPRAYVNEARVKNTRFPVTDIVISDSDYRLKTLGRVENTSAKDEHIVHVAIVFFDANDQPIGVDTTILMDGLAAGDKIGFETKTSSLPSDVTAENIASYEAFAYPLQFQF